MDKWLNAAITVALVVLCAVVFMSIPRASTPVEAVPPLGNCEQELEQCYEFCYKTEERLDMCFEDLVFYINANGMEEWYEERMKRMYGRWR